MQCSVSQYLALVIIGEELLKKVPLMLLKLQYAIHFKFTGALNVGYSPINMQCSSVETPHLTHISGSIVEPLCAKYFYFQSKIYDMLLSIVLMFYRELKHFTLQNF